MPSVLYNETRSYAYRFQESADSDFRGECVGLCCHAQPARGMAEGGQWPHTSTETACHGSLGLLLAV